MPATFLRAAHCKKIGKIFIFRSTSIDCEESLNDSVLDDLEEVNLMNANEFELVERMYLESFTVFSQVLGVSNDQESESLGLRFSSVGRGRFGLAPRRELNFLVLLLLYITNDLFNNI